MSEQEIKKEFMPVMSLLKEIVDRHPDIDYVTVTRHADHKFSCTMVNSKNATFVNDDELEVQ